MIVLALRTDKEQAELYLCDGAKKIGELKWQAHRQLTETIHQKLQQLLNELSIGLDDLGGIICFQGPGSFTGLRIGLSVANALAYSLDIPIVVKRDQNWQLDGSKALMAGKSDKIAKPFYDRPAAVTPPKK